MIQRICIDVRPIVARTRLVCMCHDIDMTQEAAVVLQDYGYDKLIQDLILYGNDYIDLPGKPHHARVEEKLNTLYSIEIDAEYLGFILDELEYTIYSIYKLDTFLITPTFAEWPLIFGTIKAYDCT